MTARLVLTCEEHPTLLFCDDDEGFKGVETAAAARALWAVKHPGKDDTKTARVVLVCEIERCWHMVSFPADSLTEGLTYALSHNYGWYVARRAGGRFVHGCQWHLGTCCVHHARRLWRGRPDPTLDPTAVLPGEPDFPGQAGTGRPDLFDFLASKTGGDAG
ncbi:hypothetical protein [Nonomuraea angiospora]|uniref:hypothetical protein n=1 Tax=Nonomuraea angiospora TaxID=46172 RepID=UPI0029ADF78D|nr:hypothetical protein [Nonomuraea angiospora]MDX3100501.1 hypothetical protein [Nonomuraea angiospora]